MEIIKEQSLRHNECASLEFWGCCQSSDQTCIFSISSSEWEGIINGNSRYSLVFGETLSKSDGSELVKQLYFLGFHCVYYPIFIALVMREDIE